jgi:hypothetical protein
MSLDREQMNFDEDSRESTRAVKVLQMQRLRESCLWHTAWNYGPVASLTGDGGDNMTISPVSAAVAGALISGVAMYAVGPRADRVDAFAQPTAYVETVDGQIIPVTPAVQPAGVNSLGSGFVPVSQRTVLPNPTATRAVYRTAAPAQQRVVTRERSGRSWKKTAMVIGGSTAGGAGVGGIMGGKKGALVGAAIGGGAASIYEASKR